MRTQFGNIPLMTLLAASLTAGSGCSDLTAGQVAPPKGGPKLVRATVQDYRFIGGPPAQRGGIVDLLDTDATSPPVACAINNPCVTQFLIAQTFPDLTCPDSGPGAGFCIDPLKVTSAGVPLSDAFTSIRLVFNKQLNPSISPVKTDAFGAQLPKQNSTLLPGIVEVLGPDGTAMPVTGYYDNEGSSAFTSDVIWIPFGPAIVINPTAYNAGTKYTIRIHGSKLTDDAGEAATNADGSPLADPTDIPFTTEQLTPNLGADGDYSAMGMTTIAPNDVVQYPFWESVDETTVKVAATSTGPAGFDPTAVEVFSDRGNDPTACAAAEDQTTLDIVYTKIDATTMKKVVTDWPAGSYSIQLSAIGAVGATSTFTPDPIVFTVGGTDTDPTADAGANANHVIPEQCS